MKRCLKVLFLEDSADEAERLWHELAQAGFDVEAQRLDTKEAFQARLTPDTDIILFDHDLPGFEALEALELLKQRGLDIPFLVVGSSIGEEEVLEAMERGATAYVPKDRLARLGPSVERALEEWRQRRAKQQGRPAVLDPDGDSILIVDDQPANLCLLRDLLSEQGYLTRGAINGAVALRAAQAKPPDLILLDIKMPNMSGFEVCEQLKADEATREIPIIFLSAAKEASDKEQAFEVGGEDYVTKPFQVEEVLARVKHHLALRRLRQKLRRLNASLEQKVEERTRALSQANARQRESEEKLRSISDNSPDFMLLVSLEGDIQFINRTLTGQTVEEVVGTSIFDYVPVVDRQKIADTIAQVIETAKPGKYDNDYEVSEEEIIAFETRVGPVVRDGEVVALTFNIRDITERKRAVEELIAAKEQAEEMSRLKSAFLTNMSHEIRTPLAGIIGFATLLAKEVPEQQREPVCLIEQNGQRLLHMLNSVLDLSMLEAGSLHLNSELINVVDEVQQRVALLRPLAEQKGLPLRVVAPTANIKALLDRAHLDRILNNLVGNAIKFTERGEVTVEIHPVDGRMDIRVADTGVGISAAFLPRLFEAFKQESTGTARLYEGVGLGLTITKQLVDLMEGTITVESQKGRGSTFTVSFPQVAPTDGTRDRDARPAIARNGRAYPSNGQDQVPARVLAVDDNPAMLLLLERYLGGVRRGYNDRREDGPGPGTAAPV